MTVTWTYSTAQDKANNAVQDWVEGDYWNVVYCDGEVIDYLEGTVRIHYVYHFVHGVFVKQIVSAKGEVISRSGEVFKVLEKGKWFELGSHDVYTVFKFNMKGDKGTHYQGTMTYYWFTGEMTFSKIKCH